MTSFDELLDDGSHFGRYQIFVVVLLCIPAAILNGWNAYGMVFFAFTPKNYTCADGANANVNFTDFPLGSFAHKNLSMDADQCSYEISSHDGKNVSKFLCTKWTYDKSHFESTLVTDLNLICDKAVQSKNMISVLGVAGVLGLLTFSSFQDAFGRKPAFLASLTLYIFGASVSAFTHSIYAFTALRAFAASQFDVSYNVPYIWMMEYFGPSKRTMVNCTVAVTFGVSSAFLALLAYLIPDWRRLALATSLPFVFCYTYAIAVAESPRWLFSRGRVEEAAEVVRKIARWNGKKLTREDAEVRLRLIANGETHNACASLDECNNEKTQKRPTFLDLFRGRNMRLKTSLITFAWLSNAVTYYSIAFNLENLGGNPFITFALQAVMEAPANVLNAFLLNRVGRILPLTISMVTCSLCCFLSAPASSFGAWQELVFVTLAKFAICSSYNIMFQLSSEIYPTTVRGLGMGFSCLAGNLGVIIMPYIVYSAEAHPTLPMIILGVMTLGGAVASAFLPETMDEYMPQTVEDAERYGLVGWNTAVVAHWKRFLKLSRIRI